MNETHGQIEDLKSGEVFTIVDETDGEIYFYDESDRWCYFDKSEEGTNYRRIPVETPTDNFVRTAWGIECFLCKTESGYKSWMLLPSDLSDEEVMSEIKAAEKRLEGNSLPAE